MGWGIFPGAPLGELVTVYIWVIPDAFHAFCATSPSELNTVKWFDKELIS